MGEPDLVIPRRFKIPEWVAVGGFFVLLLAVGLMIFKDYGVHRDEYHNQVFGQRWAKYSVEVLKAGSLGVALPRYGHHDLCHGPAFEIFLAFLAEHLPSKNSRNILWMRHLSVFLLFYVGVIFFYFLCRRVLKSWRLALLGCALLVMSPRIFADAFYNSVDIAFLVFFTLGLFTLLRMLDKKTVGASAAHAFACAVLIDVRPLGVFLPILSTIFFLFEVFRLRVPQERWRALITFLFFILSLGVLTVAFNPFLWSAPWTHLLEMIRFLRKLRLDWPMVYGGLGLTVRKMPWHYAPVWILVSTPILYGVFFLMGLFTAIRVLLKNTDGRSLTRRDAAVFLISFFLPMLFSRGRLYNGWRHIYFIYPIFLILALGGFQGLWKNSGLVLRKVLVVGIALSFLETAIFMIVNHPYQNLYFNRMGGANAAEITRRFELDYWGLTYREALEYILKTDKDQRIPINFYQGPGGESLEILSTMERKRLVLTTVDKAKYFLTEEMTKPYPSKGEEYYSVQVNGVKVMVIYKLPPPEARPPAQVTPQP